MVGLDGILSYPEEESLYVEKQTKTLGQDEFLKLFLAQMNHQDPLNPMSNEDFTAQLAQFSSLEQLFNVNEHLESIRSTQDLTTRYQALDLIGKEIVAKGNALTLEEGKTSAGGFFLEDFADCTVLITDSSGLYIRQIPLNLLQPGEHSFQWDGKNDAGAVQEPGVYSFTIAATNEYGQTLPVETRIEGKITGVNMEESTPVLYVGEIPLNMSQVLEIKVPEGSPAQSEEPADGSDDTDVQE
jgi:flagellar basal-body rod modification protein FlgD